MPRRFDLLRQPLNAVLAAEGNVRVLRALVLHGGELAPSDLAARTGLTAQAVRNTLAALKDTGTVESVGLGRYRQFRLRHDDPLVPALEALYVAERDRYRSLLEAIRQAAGAVDPAPEAVWLYGSAARHEDRPGSDVDVAAVFAAEPVEPAVAALREALSDAAERMGITLSVVGLGHDDVRRLAGQDAWWEGLRKDALALVGDEPDRYARRLLRAMSKEA